MTPTELAYNAGRTALLIVDPYHDSLTEGGKLFNAIKETADASGLCANLLRIIPAVRAAGIRVVIVPRHRSYPHGDDYAGWQHTNMFQEKNLPIKAFEAGTWGGEFNAEFAPRPDATAAFHPGGMRAAEVNAPLVAPAIMLTDYPLAQLAGLTFRHPRGVAHVRP